MNIEETVHENRLRLTTNGVLKEIRNERIKQRAKWGNGHDDEHDQGELAGAGSAYALNASYLIGDEAPLDEPPLGWFWKHSDWKPASCTSGVRRELVKAAALLVAEIERMDRIIPNCG